MPLRASATESRCNSGRELPRRRDRRRRAQKIVRTVRHADPPEGCGPAEDETRRRERKLELFQFGPKIGSFFRLFAFGDHLAEWAGT